MTARTRQLEQPSLGILLLILAAACSPDSKDVTGPQAPPASSAVAVPLAGITAAGVCDFDPTESALTGPGWTKVFEDGFSGNLSQWTIWSGGAVNEGLRRYQAAN